MHEINCPHCGKAFKIDEAGYADILKQVRDGEFEQQLHERLELAEQDKRNAVELATTKVASELQRAAAMWPSLRTDELLAMATRHGARSLGQPALGRLRRGGRADFVVLPASRTSTSTNGAMAAFAAFVAGAAPLAVCLRGRWQRPVHGA